jgi:protein SERAC1
VFLGTPHRGSDVASWTDFLARALHIAQLNTGTNKNLVSALKKDSETLSEISRQFVQRGANLEIRSFFETELLEYMNCLVGPTPIMLSTSFC